jgi:hypothetical protein
VVAASGAVAYAAAASWSDDDIAAALAAAGEAAASTDAQQQEQAAVEAPCAAEALLLALQARPGCAGLHVLQLPQGHAAMAESQACHYALAAGDGQPAVWPDFAAAAEGELQDAAAAAAAATEPAAAAAAEPSAAGDGQEGCRQLRAQLQRPALWLPPRLFVLHPQGGGHELLDPAAFQRYLAARESAPGCTVSRRPLANSGDDPGAASWCFLTRHAQEAQPGGLRELPVFCGVQPVAQDPRQAGPGGLPGLRRPSTFRCACLWPAGCAGRGACSVRATLRFAVTTAGLRCLPDAAGPPRRPLALSCRACAASRRGATSCCRRRRRW